MNGSYLTPFLASGNFDFRFRLQARPSNFPGLHKFQGNGKLDFMFGNCFHPDSVHYFVSKFYKVSWENRFIFKRKSRECFSRDEQFDALNKFRLHRSNNNPLLK